MRRHICKLALGLTVTASLSGCAAFDPFIEHSFNFKDPKSSKLCLGEQPLEGETQLRYACAVLGELEDARAQITRTQSGMVATLVPVAGIIGYNAARGINDATNAALAAGGLATYTVGSTLAQPDRVRVYNAGIKSITCAIDTYKLTEAEFGGESPSVVKLYELVGQAEQFLEELKLSPESEAAVKKFLSTVTTDASELNHLRYLKAQLSASVSETVDLVNVQLTQTIAAPASSLSSPFGVFAGYKPKKDAEVDTLLGNAKATLPKPNTRSGAKDGVAKLNEQLDAIKDQYGIVVATSKAELAKADFTACGFKLSDATTTAVFSRLMLGPNDALNGQTIELKDGENRTIPIYGGIPPYAVSVVPGPSNMAIIESTKGVPVLTITGSNKPATVLVSDSSGTQSKQLTVNVAN